MAIRFLSGSLSSPVARTSCRTPQAKMSSVHIASKLPPQVKTPANWAKKEIKVLASRNLPLPLKAEQADVVKSERSSPLSFDEYVKKNLLTFEEFKEENSKKFGSDTCRIERSYKMYCKMGYNGYLHDKEFFNSTII